MVGRNMVPAQSVAETQFSLSGAPPDFQLGLPDTLSAGHRPMDSYSIAGLLSPLPSIAPTVAEPGPLLALPFPSASGAFDATDRSPNENQPMWLPAEHEPTSFFPHAPSPTPSNAGRSMASTPSFRAPPSPNTQAGHSASFFAWMPQSAQTSAAAPAPSSPSCALTSPGTSRQYAPPLGRDGDTLAMEQLKAFENQRAQLTSTPVSTRPPYPGIRRG